MPYRQPGEGAFASSVAGGGEGGAEQPAMNRGGVA